MIFIRKQGFLFHRERAFFPVDRFRSAGAGKLTKIIT